MTTINATTARKNLYGLIEKVNENARPITIVNSRGSNAVLISEEDWRGIEETIYLNSIPGMVDSIVEASGEQEELLSTYDSSKGL